MPLHPQDQSAILAISKADIEKTLGGLKQFTRKALWLSKNNSYSLDVVKKIKDELSSGGLHNPKHLAQYITASSLLHASDGWSYLGKALSALASGDPRRAIHFGYYAELRAAMSLLATEGIGVFDTKHFIVNSTNSVAKLRNGGGTHVFGWEALEAWAGIPSSGQLFASLVQPDGRSLNEWLFKIGGGSAASPQARQWFLQWGMDLMSANGDRDLRNESSYRPDGIPTTKTMDARETIQFISDVWISLEPSRLSKFDSIDRQILRLALEGIYEGRFGQKSSADSAAFEVFVGGVVADQGYQGAKAQQLSDFLCRRTDAEDHSIFRFSALPADHRAFGHLAVIARATLLLRIASGASSELLASAGHGAESLAFWSDAIGNARGLWDGAKAITDLTDLWADVMESIDAVDEMQRDVANDTFHKIRDGLAPAIAVLGTCERVGLWSLLPA